MVYFYVLYFSIVSKQTMTLPFLACSAGVFFERASFSRHVETSAEERRRWDQSKGAGRGRGERRENTCPKTL